MIDPDQMVQFRGYVIWVRAVYSRVNIHILRKSSNQCLVDSSKLRLKLLVWMEDCVDPDQIVHFRSYAIWVFAKVSKWTGYARGQISA